jgi:predicted PurR-regulated permease PerM
MSSGSHVFDRVAAVAWRVLVVAGALYVLAIAFRTLQVLVVSVIISLFIASLLTPAAEWMVRRGVPRMAATWVLMLGSLGLIGGIITAIAPTVIQQFGQLGPTLEEAWDRIEEWLIAGPLDLSESQLAEYQERIFDAVRGATDRIVTGVIAGAVLAIEVIVGVLLSLVLVFFLVKDGHKLTGWVFRHLDEQHHELARALGRRTYEAGGGYIRGTSIVALVDAIGIGIGLAIIGVPLVLPLAILTFFGGFFPLVGATVAGAIAVMVALVTLGWTEALLTLGVVLLVQQTESNLLQPIVMSRAIKIHPIMVLVALTAGGLIAGIVGAFLAVPIAAVAAAIGNELRSRDLIGPNAPYKSTSG